MAGAVNRHSPASSTICARVRKRTSRVVRDSVSKASTSAAVNSGISNGLRMVASSLRQHTAFP